MLQLVGLAEMRSFDPLMEGLIVRGGAFSVRPLLEDERWSALRFLDEQLGGRFEPAPFRLDTERPDRIPEASGGEDQAPTDDPDTAIGKDQAPTDSPGAAEREDRALDALTRICSPREAQLLAELRRGGHLFEAAARMGIKASTARVMLHRLKRKASTLGRV